MPVHVSELRRLFLSEGHFPMLPNVAREVLRLPRHPSDAAWKEIAAMASFDPDLSHALLEAAEASAAGAPAAGLEGVVACLGRGGLREAVFRRLAPRLFPEKGGRRLDRATFWRHAFTAAECAVQLAKRLHAPCEDDAYVAALLHDIGKAALDSVVDGGYSSAFEAAHAQGLSALEAERREMGVDHTLAGKWLAEHWGLPGPFVAAIWLHHHPPGVLDETHYPIQLIDIVALADALAHRSASGVVLPDAERRAARLGVTLDDLLDLPGPREEHEGPAPGPAPVETAIPASEVQRLRNRAARYEALHDLNRAIAAGHPRESGGRAAVLGAIAVAFRNAFGVQAGFCYAIDEAGGALDGVVWRSNTEEPRPMHLALGEGTGNQDAPAAAAIAALLEELVKGEDTAPARGGDLEALVRQHGLGAMPMPYQGRGLGQLIFDATHSQLRFTKEDTADLVAFGEACGLALFRCLERQRLQEQSEELATAVWKQELGHRAAIRSERIASIAKLAAGAAHEINNPLAAISGRAQMLLSRATDPSQAKALDVIVQQSRRVNRILTDLMQFARPAEPKLEPNLISYILHKVVSVRLDQLEAKGIRVVEDYAVGLPRSRVDRHQMEQVFLNVILNAEQAMAGAGGTLSLRVAHKPESKAILVQISDTGPGIPSNIVDRIFEPFFTTREENENTGLGLAVCHGIIENHRGTINVHSAKGQGTTFTITLPAPAAATAADAGSKERAAAPPASAARDAHITILIVDPNQDLRDVLSAALENRGYQTRTAEDGLEALATLLGFPVDLVLLDLAVSQVQGVPPLRYIAERFPALPVVVTSSFASSEEAQAARQLGARGYLPKPFEVERLLGEVEHILRSRNVA